MFLKVAVFALLVGICLAQLDAEGRQASVTIDCRDQSAVAEAIKRNSNFKCAQAPQRSVFKKCPEGQIFNSELGICVNNPNENSASSKRN